jgi:hypothetical protein
MGDNYKGVFSGAQTRVFHKRVKKTVPAAPSPGKEFTLASCQPCDGLLFPRAPGDGDAVMAELVDALP